LDTPSYNTIEQSFWKDNSRSTGQEMAHRNMLMFYGEVFLALHPTSKLDQYPLSAVRDCLFSILAGI